MKNSRKVIEKLVELASNDQLPLDLNELSPSHFDFLDEKENIGGFTIEDIKDMAHQVDQDLTEEQYKKVMFKLEKEFNAQIGVNWDVIESAVHRTIAEDENKS